MNEPIPRRRYPETRDEQAMRRFMLGTLNVGHNMTFQRKSMIVNVSPQNAERECLAKFFDALGVHRTERCYNVKLTIHPHPLAENVRLSRESEYNCFPYSHAEVTLTPACAISEAGKKRNMHMQTHELLPNAPSVQVYGVGYRKGEVAMLQFVKDCVTFQHDLDRDDAEIAARNQRPFILPPTMTATDYLLEMPAHPTLTLRDLFDSQSEQAPTPSDVAGRAQSAVAALLYPALQPHQLLGPASNSQPYNPAETAPYAHIVPASTLIRRKSSINNDASSSRSRLADRVRGPPASTSKPSDADMRKLLEQAFRAAKMVYPLDKSLPPRVPLHLSSLPDTKVFLDLERCRAALRNTPITHVDVANAWYEHRKGLLTCPMPAVPAAPASDSVPEAPGQTIVQDDSGVALVDDQRADNDPRGQRSRTWEQSSFDMLSSEHPRHTSRPASLKDDEGTPTLTAASTLLSLSPVKATIQE